MKRSMRGFTTLLIALQLMGCSMPKLPNILRFEGNKLDWSAVTLSASSNANKNSAIAVDVVLVLDTGMAQRVQEMTADKWFSERVDLQKTFPEGLRYFAWELVPGQVLRVPRSSLERPRVVAAYVFANYLSPGVNRQRIDVLKGELVIKLEEKKFEAFGSL